MPEIKPHENERIAYRRIYLCKFLSLINDAKRDMHPDDISGMLIEAFKDVDEVTVFAMDDIKMTKESSHV